MSNADLIRRLREGTEGTDIAKTDPYLNAVMREAADALEAAEAEVASKSEWIAKQQMDIVILGQMAGRAEAAEARIADVEQANRDCVEHFDQMRGRAEVAEAEVELLREALGEMLSEYGGKYDAECRLKTASELEIIARARAALHPARRDAAEGHAPAKEEPLGGQAGRGHSLEGGTRGLRGSVTD